jgi:hypothetical protein
MASSGVTAYTYTRDQIINAALRKLSVLSEGVSANATQLSTGAEALNLLILQLQPLGLPLWARKVKTTTMVSGTSSYTLSSPKPLKILQAYFTDATTSTRRDIMFVPDYDFTLYPPGSSGTPVAITYQPQVGSGTMKVWPTPDSTMAVGSTISVVYQAEFEVFTASGETPDFPQEWYNTLVYQLAVLLAPEYGIPTQDQSKLEQQAEKFLTTVLSMGSEDGSVMFQPARY